MLATKKDVEKLKEEFQALSEAYNSLVTTVINQQEEINELKKPKEPEYMA